MAHPDDAQRALNTTQADISAQSLAEPSNPPVKPAPAAPRTPWLSLSRLALIFVVALIICAVAYLAFAVPGPWISSAHEKAYGAQQLSLPRGTANVAGNELVVTAAAPDGNTVISVNTDFRSADYPIIAWVAAGVTDDARVALLWRTDVEPARVNKQAIEVTGGQLLPLDVHKDPHWLGRIVGLALVVQGPIEQPLRVRGVIAKSADALETFRDRFREWTAPEAWTGASINTISGGADVQPLPLPLFLAAAVAVAVAFTWLVVRKRAHMLVHVAAASVVFTLFAWFLLDARWTTNLFQQARATALRYAGKDLREKHLAGEDRELFAFIDKARTILPPTPARVFVLADADFFRGRAAYHLYPHNVWYEPYKNVVPPANQLKPGDWLVVYQRRGVQYDAARHSLRWDGGVTIPVELKLLEHGGALFVVQ